MENKKYLPLKVIHLIVMVTGIALYFITLIKFYKNGSTLAHLSTILNIVALISGVVYFAFGYKKDAALFYKIYMWAYAFSTIIDYTSMFTTRGVGVAESTSVTLISFISFALIILLAGAKDYGAVKSNVISLSLLAINIYNVIRVSCSADKLSGTGLFIPILFAAVGQLILASSASFMVCGKYLDKASRGAK